MSTAAAAEAALQELAEMLRGEDSVISPLVRDPAVDPAIGRLVAAGPRAAADPGSYALLIEATREGYLLHYGEARIIAGADPDLALLAGDYLYATGLERLAALGDSEAVRELSDLISLSAQVHDYRGDGHDDEGVDYLAAALWLSSAVAVGCGQSRGHEEAKRMVRSGDADCAAAFWSNAQETARECGIETPLESASEAIGFAPI